MFRNLLALVPVAAVLLFGSSLHSNAQTYHSTNQVGSINGAMAISVVGSSWDSGIKTVPVQINGTVNISGFFGVFGLSVSAPVDTMVTDTTKINGRTYKRTRIATKTFPYVDLNSGVTIIAIMQATVINFSRGSINFQIVDAVTGVTLAATSTPDGQMKPMSLTSGSTSIN